MKREIYLDNSATTRTFREIADMMSETQCERFGNPSSLHTKGIEAERLIRKARETIAATLNAQPSQIYFTSGGTESNNLAVRGYLSANARSGRRLITTETEHPSVLEVFRALEKDGYEVLYLKVGHDGLIDIEELAEGLSESTALVSIIMVNSETGALQPVERISRLIAAKSPRTAFHVDAVQAYGKYKLEPARTDIALMSLSSHKIHGPKGIGALYVKKGTRLRPVLFGGGQEAALRSGTENVAGICGFGAAAGKVAGQLEENYKKVTALKALFIEKLGDAVPDCRVISPSGSSPYILNIAFPGVKAEVLLHHLEREGIYVSTGSACSSRKKVRSHVLTAMGIEPLLADGAVRFSFSAYENGESDVTDAIEAVKSIAPGITAARRAGR